MKITKEQYDKLNNNRSPYGNRIKSDLAREMGLINDWAWYGYGVKDCYIKEENGEYFFTYTCYEGGLD